MKASTFVASLDLTSSETGTSPAAFSGATCGTGSGGTRLRSLAVAVATAVTTFELISLRCIGAKSYIAVMASGKKVDEPAARVLGTHRNAVNYSISQVFFGEPSVSAGVSDSRAAFAPGQDDRATLTFRRTADLALR